MYELFLDPLEELKVFLLEQEKISVTPLVLSMKKDFLNNYITNNFYREINGKNKLRYSFKRIKPEIINAFRKELKRKKFSYFEPNSNIGYSFKNNALVINENISFIASKNTRLLYLIHNEKTNPVQKLQLMGWPKEDAYSFIHQDQELKINNNYLLVNLAKAKKENVLPLYFAYLTYVPSKFNLINEDVKIQTIAHCTNLMKFTRKHNPGLARRVEDEFKNREYPTDWKLIDNGYAIHYESRFDHEKMSKNQTLDLLKKLN